MTDFEQESWIINWQGEWNLYLRKSISVWIRTMIPNAWLPQHGKCYVNIPSTTFSASKFMARSLVISFITTWLLKLFLMLTVLIYKKVVYLWSFFPSFFWSKLLLAPYTMAFSVLPIPSCVQAFTNTVIPSVWRTFVFLFCFLFFFHFYSLRSLNISVIWKQSLRYCHQPN